MLIILFGAGGSGKTTLKEGLLALNSNFSNIVCTTTRSKRAGEIEAKDYYFVSKEEFQKRKYRMGFNNGIDYYGIEEKELSKANGVVAIDLSLAGEVEKIFADQNLRIIYLNPSQGALKRRMIGRGDQITKIASRLHRDNLLLEKFDISLFKSPCIEFRNESKEEILQKTISFIHTTKISQKQLNKIRNQGRTNG